jgi:hypothetical protein
MKGLAIMKACTETTTATWEIPFEFSEQLPNDRSALLVNSASKALYLVDSGTVDGKEAVRVGGSLVTLDKLDPAELEPCTLKEALAWYARNANAASSFGNVGILCAMAAEALN